jgi:hypothetical protein
MPFVVGAELALVVMVIVAIIGEARRHGGGGDGAGEKRDNKAQTATHHSAQGTGNPGHGK